MKNILFIFLFSFGIAKAQLPAIIGVIASSSVTPSAPIAFDAAVAAQTGNNPSWTHTCTGSNRLLVVTGYGSADYTGITYNGVALTKAISANANAGTQKLQIWYLLNPAAGANTLAVTGNNGRCQSASYTGVKQSGFPDASASVVGGTTVGAGNITCSLSIVAAGCWVVGTSYDSALNPDAGVVLTTKRGGTAFFGSGALDDSNGIVAAGATSVGYHYTGSNTADIVTVSFSPIP